MTTLAIPITKAKAPLPVSTKNPDGSEVFSDEIYEMIFAEGLKTILNKNMSKIAVKDLDGEDLAKAQAAAMEKAKENLQSLIDGNVKKRKSASKESREVTTEARRLAREAVKAAIKAAGKKVTGIKASVITQYADELIAEDPQYLAKAKDNVKKMHERESIVAPAQGNLAKLIESAETAKPKVAPSRKKKETATAEDVQAALGKAKGKGKAAHATH
jgi:hypothetical protein